MSVTLPPVNVTQVPLFKTSNDSSLFEMRSLVQALPQPSTGHPVNVDGMVSILKQMAGEHRTLMLSKRERDIKAKLLECISNIKRSLTLRDITTLKMEIQQIMKGNFSSFMQKEIF